MKRLRAERWTRGRMSVGLLVVWWIQVDGMLLTREFVWCRFASVRNPLALREQHTFDRVSRCHLPSRLRRKHFFLFFLPPLCLLDPLVMIIHSYAQNFLGPLLSNNELIQMRFQHFRCYPGTVNLGITEGSTGRLSRLVYTSEALVCEV